MRSNILVVVLLSAVCTLAHADVVDDYAYAWPLQTEGDSAAWQVELTPEVYAAISTDDLRDVGVINGAGHAVPIAPYQAMTRTTPGSAATIDLPVFWLPATPASSGSNDAPILLHIERGADGKLRRMDAQVGDSPVVGTATPAPQQRDALLDASGMHVPLESLRIDWDASAGDVTARFAISGSDDLQQWHLLVADASVLRLIQQGKTLSRHDVALQHVNATYLRLHRLDDGPDLPKLTVQARSISQSTRASVPRLWLAATADADAAQQPDPASHRSGVVYTYHLPAVLPIAAAKIELADDNSVAQVDIYSRLRNGRAQPGAWTPRGGGMAFRLREADSVIGNDELPIIPPNRAREWELNVAMPFDHIPTLRLAFTPDRFVFLAQGGGPYRLVAGSARAQHADYPVAAALAQLRARLGANWQPPLATLGARATLQGDRALESPAPAPVPRDWKTWLLWLVLVAAAALIGGLALSLLRKPVGK